MDFQYLEDLISEAIVFLDKNYKSHITFIGFSKGGAEAMVNAIIINTSDEKLNQINAIRKHLVHAVIERVKEC